jgi:hypothetical protein
MITRTQAYQVGSETFQELSEAQIHALTEIVRNAAAGEISPSEQKIMQDVIRTLVNALPRTLDILSTKPNSRAVARKVNGATRKSRKATPVETKAGV